ncbi:MAG: hypothetical protein QOG67_2535 [Verrucomicrobiota bacterium]|jgi:hypothetical protein
MPLVQFHIFGKGEDGSPIKTLEVECDFLPRVGDVFNTFDLFDDLEAEGNHYSIVYKIDWSIHSNRAVPVVKLNSYDDKHGDYRLNMLRRHEWLPPKAG